MSTAKDPYKYFRVEARELLDGLGQGLLELERGAHSRDLVARLLRLTHTLKGAARVVKLTEIARRAHALEDALAPYREEGPLPPGGIDQLLRLLDGMSTDLAAIDQAPSTSTDPAATPRTVDEPFATVRIELEEMDLLLEGVTEATVQINALHRETETFDRTRHLAQLLVEQLRPRRQPADAHALAARAHALAEELRGSLDRLRRDVSSGVEMVSRELAQVREAANRLRLLPASVVFGPLERALRDAAQVLHRKVMFRTSGGDGRLDAHVLGALRDALLHMVRNAVVHGIEPEHERLASGKAAAGVVSLDVERRGSTVAFVCRDDGRGIDLENLRSAAVRAGILTVAAAADAGAKELFPLLLRGGLTTSSAVTELAGRGIGLDVVRETVAGLKGEVSIASEPGRGTSIEIRVPVSLSSLPALAVEAAGIAAVVPLDSVRRTLRLADSEISRASTSDSIVYEGKVIPFVPLAKALRRSTGAAGERRRWSAVVVQSGSGLAALGVDRMLGTGDVVVRPLPSHVDVDPVVAGASFDAEGNARLVLDPGGLVLSAQAGRGLSEATAAPKLPVLVVDDSLTTRMLEQSILESAGYEVALATSAEEALVKATARRYGLFVVDVEMPGMDGFEFVARTRADPVLRDTPAILVTSRGSPEDRRKGEAAGARAYIVKGEFDQGQLLRSIRELLG